LDGDNLYLVSDSGVAACLDARQGKVRWQGRLGGNFSASPVLAGGHLYFCSETGVTSVVEPSPAAFKRLATNKLDGRIFASPAISGRAIYLRTDRHMYRIESPDE
jgi:outer membrane protein assembly factor BamB